ncbi:MAG: AAA family ATPase [Candidatus Magasanikbacteria bacterium]
MLFEKQVPLNLLPCPTCQGSGYSGITKCRECKGMSMGRFARGGFLYWGEPLTNYHISVRRARRHLNHFRIIGSLIFGVGFLILFVWLAYDRGIFGDVLTVRFWQLQGNTLPSLFFIALTALGYLSYRLVVSNPEPENVEYHEYKEDKKLLEEKDEQVMQTWGEVFKLPRSKRQNIALTFSYGARGVLEEAYFQAHKNFSQNVEPAHVFHALLSSTRVSNIFIRLGIPVHPLQARLAKFYLKSEEKKVPIISEDLQQILFKAYEKAYVDRQEYVDVTELLIATVEQSESIQELLYDLKIDKEKLNNVVEWMRIREKLRRQYRKLQKAGSHRSKYGLDRAMTAVATPYLNSFSEDLTMAAKYGNLSACVAREKEIEEVFRIVEGGRQSIILVGERGVGKMSIIEGIARKMVEEDVPDRLKEKRLVQLSTSALLAGTTVSGAQERLIKIMHEVSRARNIILFIKNIHDLISAGSDETGESLDVSEALAEYLGPGKFLTFATTTPEGYKRHVVNSEIGSVLSKVNVKEMDQNQAIQVLESKVGYVEYKNSIFFSYDALQKSVELAEKFLYDQNLPESAISVMTEAASYTKNEKGADHLVTAEDVGQIVSNKTGIPTTSITEDESDKLMRLEEEMHKRIIGQNEAVMLVASALRRARAEMRSDKKPIANFLFLGPTGVGKTELAKTIANVYFGGEERMVRIDMSEYQDKTGIYRLIGQPNQQGSGILTEAVRQQPFSLILLDELEKADPDILNLFLQVFDDGRLTDSVGKVVDFTNSIIIATSNAGTNYVQEQIVAGKSLEEIRQSLVRGELKKYYRPEFLNRFDGIVLFKSLEKEEIKQIAGLMLKRVTKDLEKRGVGFRIEESALVALADVGFDPEFGARPMRRAIQEHVENKLADLILQNKLERRDVVVLGKGLEVRVERDK